MKKVEDKLLNYISQLTDEEIAEQLQNIFQWAQKYQQMLEAEQKARTHKKYSDATDSETSYLADDNEETDTQSDPGFSIDYYYVQAIQEKLRRMSEDEIQASLDDLKKLNTTSFSDEERELLAYEIDACELYLHDIRQDVEENRICPQCGNILPQNARFCTKCGTKIEN